MDVIESISDLRLRLTHQHNIAFVPTMGNLHAGHCALVKQARQHGRCVVVSIFVNPLQFGANEDLAAYPRTLQQDLEKMQALDVDVVFTPTDTELYPQLQSFGIAPTSMANELCGANRPGHFSGVCTVVAKLFNIVQPEFAVFGKKDFQQLFILKQMTHQLNFPITILSGETVRETDGLAISSRNSYLNPEQRTEAPRLYQALQQVVTAVQHGQYNFSEIQTQAVKYLSMSAWAVDYVEIRDSQTLAAAVPGDQSLVVLGAASLGKTRLIDNIEFTASS